MVEKSDLVVHLTTRGTRAAGQPCQMTLSLNGKEPLSFLEDAGKRAPLSVIVDLEMDRDMGRVLLNAFRTKPWEQPDAPSIVCPNRVSARTTHDGADIDYLVRNEPINDLIELIRDALDIQARKKAA